MMWAFCSLAVIELVVVHVLVALRWPAIGWPLTVLSAASIVWLVFWIGSFRRLPHELTGGTLILRLGSLKSVRIALADIQRITASWEPGATGASDAVNLAAIAHPNRLLELSRPMPKKRDRVFVRFDDPAAFDEAMRQRDIPVA